MSVHVEAAEHGGQNIIDYINNHNMTFLSWEVNLMYVTNTVALWALP